jgi:hypothetical protein
MAGKRDARKFYLAYLPVVFTIALLLWTAIVSPYSKYGDAWAIIPALSILPIVLGLHIFLAFKRRWQSGWIVYGVVHVSILLVVWIWCLMLISKDSL